MLGRLCWRRRRTRPRAMPLAMMTMKNQKHGSVNFLWVWGSALRPFGPLGAPLIRQQHFTTCNTKMLKTSGRNVARITGPISVHYEFNCCRAEIVPNVLIRKNIYMAGTPLLIRKGDERKGNVLVFFHACKQQIISPSYIYDA